MLLSVTPRNSFYITALKPTPKVVRSASHLRIQLKYCNNPPTPISSATYLMDRYLCIHCHFYQPPRENPWLESIELQESAYPYHDWNERITAEPHAPNAASRILTGDNRITHIVNNYSRISFNFGPTLLSWLEEHAPDTYQAILAADQESLQ